MPHALTMGTAQTLDGAVRYVSPVTARLFSGAGHSEILGVSAGEVLAPMEADWVRGQAPALGSSADQAASGMMARQQRQVEVVRPCPASPTPDFEGTSPQAYLEVILVERVSLDFVFFVVVVWCVSWGWRGKDHKGRGSSSTAAVDKSRSAVRHLPSGRHGSLVNATPVCARMTPKRKPAMQQRSGVSCSRRAEQSSSQRVHVIVTPCLYLYERCVMWVRGGVLCVKKQLKSRCGISPLSDTHDAVTPAAQLSLYLASSIFSSQCCCYLGCKRTRSSLLCALSRLSLFKFHPLSSASFPFLS